MRILVQKFGGTSVASENGWKCLAAKVRGALAEGFSPVVVVSAMGRYPDPYATDSLLSLIKRFEPVGDRREKDMLMACGEIISTAVVSHFLRSVGIEACAFSGAKAGIRTGGTFGEDSVRSINPQHLLQALEAGQVPVVAGFQGETDDADVSTLGRGGSDTTAVAIGAALNAEAVEIFTDVEGVMTADPRHVSAAHVLPVVTHLEVGEMAHEGAKVLHPRAVELAEAHKVPVLVRSTFSEAPGTLIYGEGDDQVVSHHLAKHREHDAACASVAAPAQGAAENAHNTAGTEAAQGREVIICDRCHREDSVATGIVSVSGFCAVCLDFSFVTDVTSARLRVIGDLAGASLSLDMINVANDRVYFLIRTSDLVVAKKLLEKSGFGFSVRMGCAKVSVVGQMMRGTPGVMLRVCRALARASCELLYSTDSHITISCVVPECHLRRAAESLHSEFGLDSCPDSGASESLGANVAQP